MSRSRQTDRIDLSDALIGALAVAYALGSIAAIGIALGRLAH